MAIAITGISRKRSYNKKSIDIRIDGSGFAPMAVPGAMLFLLLRDSNRTEITIDAHYHNYYGPAIQYARFNLKGQPKGVYDLVMVEGANSDTLARAFRIQ